jgi:flavin-dependent dehydrogenase
MKKLSFASSSSGAQRTRSFYTLHKERRIMYDVIIIGARCAGSPAAMLLARKGYRVLVVDKATFPSDTLSTMLIHQPGIARLKRWGLLPQLIASRCPEITSWLFDVDTQAVLTGFPPPFEGTSQSYAPRRLVLDQILVEAARTAGAEVRENFLAQELLLDGDRVKGIRGRTPGGRQVTEEARLVVGADGLRSLVARTVQAPTYNEIPALTCSYYSYWSGLPCEQFEMYMRTQQHRFIGVISTHEELTCIFISWPLGEFHAVRSDIAGNFLKALDLIPALAERVRSGKREERFVGTADIPNFFRKPYGPGWALVGDAGYHKDPIGGEGITDAFRDAELVAEAIHAGLSGQHPLEEALAGYERLRNATVMPIYNLVCQMATLEPFPADQLYLMAALSDKQKEIDRFFGVVAGTVPFEEFYAPENIGRLLSN